MHFQLCRASSHGLELVSVISSILNRCGDKSGAVATCVCLDSLRLLWKGSALAPPSTWKALEPKLGRDHRPSVQISLCKLLGEVPSLRVSNPDYDKLISEASRKLWMLVSDSNVPEVAEAACDALSAYKIDDYKLKDIPEIYRRTVKLPASFCKTPADAARKPEDVLDYVPCEIWPEVFKYTNQAALPGVSRLCSRLVEREVRAHRSGVYAPQRAEPHGLAHLHHASLARGLLECFKKQATTPSHDFPEPVLLAILHTLTSEYPKPLPPLDLCFLPEAFHRGKEWRRGCVTLAARQAQVSQSARRILENYLQGIDGNAEETDILLTFEILPILCRGMPPNALRPPLEKCLSDSFSVIANTKLKSKGIEETEYLFVKQLEMIRVCLESEKIHDANRTLLSQIVESYMSVLNDDNVAWPAYVRTCRCLSSKYLERMTSPSGWWEVSSALLRKASAVRCAVAEMGDCDTALNWLNEIIDAQAGQLTEQEFSLRCMFPALKAAKPDAASTKQWLLQLMGRTQVAFNETEDKSAKLYLCDVFMLCVVVFSGVYAVEGGEVAVAADRRVRHELLPAAAAELARIWPDCSLQLLEWLSPRGCALGSPPAARTCQRALLAARHAPHFATHRIWTRLESHFGRDIIDENL
ncbi:unnamed protein product [Arctia plantaginis]|uniref:Uncharacterized protein n=1 Tax=Arctia plantaginis TaxID=874455 RepID=A0A8S0YL22_ARCPL|nr:unnamed protein product [Arctia plantaginis]